MRHAESKAPLPTKATYSSCSTYHLYFLLGFIKPSISLSSIPNYADPDRVGIFLYIYIYLLGGELSSIVKMVFVKNVTKRYTSFSRVYRLSANQ